ncbi:MAG: nucleotidyl transferase AbiEii/AbiGii toxin family protein [Bacteroidetes bacterium]|nr:nucleotidyl transferase AbiEii/AbiGii toxin family protein [Bacteroidota bacterium]
MLHTSTVEQHTLDILKELMNIPELNHFFLVGGTCLSLRFGHRKSVDLDLFATNDFDNNGLSKILENNFK